MPFKGYQTYYRIVGEPTDNAPLLLIHGGPGSTHNYFEVLDDLAVTTRRQIISYDQIGCGESYVDGHPELWTLTTWLDELEALRSHLNLNRVNLLGQSWGGMLIIAYMIDRHPEGVESIILSSTLPSSELWSHEQQRLISFMPADEQEAIARAVATGNFDDPAYLKRQRPLYRPPCRRDYRCLTGVLPSTEALRHRVVSHCLGTERVHPDWHSPRFRLYRPSGRDYRPHPHHQRNERRVYAADSQDDGR